MKLALQRRGDYPEPIRAELEQLVAAIQTGWGIEHDGEGRQRQLWQRWTLGSDLSVATATVVTIPMRLPDPLSTGDLTLDPVGGIVTVRTPGLYLIEVQLRWANNATGVRAAMIFCDQVRRAHHQVLATTGGIDTQVSVAATFPCVVGTTISCAGVQTSGGALTLTAKSGTAHESFLTITRVA